MKFLIDESVDASISSILSKEGYRIKDIRNLSAVRKNIAILQLSFMVINQDKIRLKKLPV